MRKYISVYLAAEVLYMVLTIVGSFLVVSPAFAQDCEMEQVGRLRAVAFPSGEKISLVGHSHGLTAEVMDLARLADDQKNSNDVYLLNGAQSLASLKGTLKQYREDVDAIRQLIRQGDLNYIALEYGDQIMRLMTEYARVFLPMTRENLKARGLTEGQFVDDAFLVFAGPALYLKHKESELMKNIRIVGIEDDDLMQRSLDAQSEGGTRLQSFLSKGNISEQTKNAVSNLWARAILEYDLHQFLVDEWIFNELKSQVSASLFEGAKNPIISALAAAELLRKRDAQSSQKILKLEGSGVLLIGSAHSRSLSNIFRNTCLSQKNR